MNVTKNVICWTLIGTLVMTFSSPGASAAAELEDLEEALGAPFGLVAIYDGEVVHLSWQPPFAGEDLVQEYHVYRAEGSHPLSLGEPELVGSSGETTYTDQGIAMVNPDDLAFVEYHVTAVTSEGESTSSDPAHIIIFDGPSCVRTSLNPVYVFVGTGCLRPLLPISDFPCNLFWGTGLPLLECWT